MEYDLKRRDWVRTNQETMLEIFASQGAPGARRKFVLEMKKALEVHKSRPGELSPLEAKDVREKYRRVEIYLGTQLLAYA